MPIPTERLRSTYGVTAEAVTEYLEEASVAWWAEHREAVREGDSAARKEAHHHIIITRITWALLKAVGKAI